MKTQKLGRHELLNWLNEFTQSDYPKIEVCCDGVGYCQVIDAIHPGVINLSKLNFSAKFPDEFSRNLKILDDAFTKLNFEKVVPIDKLSKGKFQDNMLFLQWLYNYSSKIGPFAIKTYKGYEKRVEAIQKQKSKLTTMNAHLIPNTAFLKLRADQRNMENFDESENYSQVFLPEKDSLSYSQSQLVTKPKAEKLAEKATVQPTNEKMSMRIKFLEELMEELETDLKEKMEYNWKMLYAIDDMQYQRNTLFSILRKIEDLNMKTPKKSIGTTIESILNYTPADFKENITGK